MLTEENNWQICLQTPLNMLDLQYCAVKLELPVGRNEVTCAMSVV